MPRPAGKFELAKTILANWRIIRAKPSVNRFLLRYLRDFTVMKTGRRLIVHSHLPPLNSLAYSRFIDDHVLRDCSGPSHAQIGVTGDCPQNCAYCYNRGRSGVTMDTRTILELVRELKEMGVFWIGLTGGEPLLNRDLPAIVRAIGEDCCAKLFTTGHGLTEELAGELKKAGLYYVTVSLDHMDEKTHDRIRGYRGAFRTALRAIETLRKLGDMHVSVSTVLSGNMLETGNVEEFLAFLRRLDVDEAWLSESKPSVQAGGGPPRVITDTERNDLMRLQDDHNRLGELTVNYLGHLEDGNRFGCTAGTKMVYIDPYGDVGPCVFLPMSFGNVREKPLRAIYGDMRGHFRTGCRCFINQNHDVVRDFYHGSVPLNRAESLRVLERVHFGPGPRYFRLQHHGELR